MRAKIEAGALQVYVCNKNQLRKHFCCEGGVLTTIRTTPKDLTNDVFPLVSEDVLNLAPTNYEQ